MGYSNANNTNNGFIYSTTYYTQAQANKNFLSATTNYALSGLSDVYVNGLADGHILIYSATTQKWVNVPTVVLTTIFYTQTQIDSMLSGITGSATTNLSYYI